MTALIYTKRAHFHTSISTLWFLNFDHHVWVFRLASVCTCKHSSMYVIARAPTHSWTQTYNRSICAPVQMHVNITTILCIYSFFLLVGIHSNFFCSWWRYSASIVTHMHSWAYSPDAKLMMHAYARTHARTYACTHARTQTHTNTHARTCELTSPDTSMASKLMINIHAYRHTDIQTRTRGVTSPDTSMASKLMTEHGSDKKEMSKLTNSIPPRWKTAHLSGWLIHANLA